ncbi:MAG: hypothetical protein EXR75_14240 [Myxococcales bacterium]|nr:hypothetical protein [Myxococcales bacterium]
MKYRSRFLGVLGLAGLAGVVALAQACELGIDTERVAPKATLGDDIYGMMCDRLGASAFTEDLSGASFHSICHFDAAGRYGDTVDLSHLPQPETEAQKRARVLSVNKLEGLAHRRALLVRALNQALPDVLIADPTTPEPTDTVRLHDALLRFSQDITALYETNPFEPGGELLPTTTRALGALFGAVESHDPARAALMHISARQAYRPFEVGLGALRTLLAYPELRPFLRAQLRVLGPAGIAAPTLELALTVAKRELLTSACELCALGPVLIDDATATPNRPRRAIEVLERLLLDESEAYLPLGGSQARYITRRDGRGFAVPLGNEPGRAGTVLAPFVDLNSDGFADVDGLGRFIDGVGAPLALDAPFYVPGKLSSPPDASGRTGVELYRYVDTSQTLAAALMRDVVALVDPTKYASPDSVEPWLSESETLMYALSGIVVLAGPRAPAQFDHVANALVPSDAPCPSATVACTSYQRFVGEASPLAALVHGFGQVLGTRDSDAVLLALETLVRDHEPVVARLIGAALAVKEIADEHDALAAKGGEPKAELAYDVPIWDEIGQIAGDMATHPGLFTRLIEALADPTIVTPHPQDVKIQEPGAEHLGETLSAFMRMRDRYSYDPNNINGPALNLVDGGSSIANPHNPVDRDQPLRGGNRSMFEASAQLIHDATRVRACNKPGAKLHTSLGIDWPLIGSYDACELFTFENMGAFYLDALLPTTHPKRALLNVKAADLNALLDFVGAFTSPDALLEASSGLTGLTLHPSGPALNRLLFFGADSTKYGKLPDYDAKNAGTTTNKFVSMAIDPVSPSVCPVNADGVGACTNPDDLLRVRDHAVIFGWERLGFQTYLRPQMKAFAELSCNSAVTACDLTDDTGENFFLDLVRTLWRHWPGSDHDEVCDHNASKGHSRYCSAAGANRYEPLLGDAFLSDLIPALHEFAKVAATVEITVARGPKKGTKVKGSAIVESLLKVLFSRDYAASVAMTDLAGKKSTKWVDGTPQAQLTGFSLVADALHAMDERFAASDVPDGAKRKSKWRRARSQLVDRFLAVEGEGGAARFKNRAVPMVLRTVLRILREQINANCPERETTGECDWARHQLGKNFADALSRPVFASVAGLVDELNEDEPARRELERFLSYALLDVGASDALQGVLASLGDLMQVLRADLELAPIFNAVSVAASPKADAAGPGCADRTVQLLTAMSGEAYDRYHILDRVLPAIVTPIDAATGLTPLEIILDAVAELNRVDAGATTPLDEQDYRFVMQTLREFFASETRGFEQLYAIAKNRQR